MSSDDQALVTEAFASEVAARFGVLPNFFCSAPAVAGLIEELWAFAKAAYLDNPLPSLFKERLFVHLSRFCEVRYCIVRHVGFLIGEGRPAGDPSVPAQTIEQALALLRRPIPDEASLDQIISRLEVKDSCDRLPLPETEEESDLFAALTTIFLAPSRSARARNSVRRAVGDRDFELITAFLAFVRTAHFWTETHPELSYEPDIVACMERHPELAGVLMNAKEAEEVRGEATRRAEAALRESKEQQRLTLQLVPALLWWADPSGRVVFPHEQWRFYTGQLDADTQDFGWLDAIHPDDVEATRAAFEHAFATGEALERQQRIRQALNGYRWHLVRHVPVRDEHGTILRWFGAAIDVRELHELQKQQQVLVAELQHRTRNLMAVVRAMADKTMARSADLVDFRARYKDRLAALARVHSLLSRLAEGEKITFDDLIRNELAALDSAEKVTLDGPKNVALRSSTVQTFALALHELVTNAVKYGAFSQPEGRLELRWRLDHAMDGRPWLHVDWRERGVAVPAKGALLQGGGSGRELIERALPYQLGARTTYVMDENGVHCTISLPVAARQLNLS